MENNLNPEQRDLAVQEAAHASSRGDTEAVEQIRSIVVPDSSDLPARAELLHDTFVADAETIKTSGKYWP